VTVLERVSELAAAMRAVGAGVATCDGLTLDLTLPPQPVAVEPTLTEAREVKADTEEKARLRYEQLVFGAGAGRRIKLPMR
jgi:hypothetical protein